MQNAILKMESGTTQDQNRIKGEFRVPRVSRLNRMCLREIRVYRRTQTDTGSLNLEWDTSVSDNVMWNIRANLYDDDARARMGPRAACCPVDGSWTGTARHATVVILLVGTTEYIQKLWPKMGAPPYRGYVFEKDHAQRVNPRGDIWVPMPGQSLEWFWMKFNEHSNCCGQCSTGFRWPTKNILDMACQQKVERVPYQPRLHVSKLLSYHCFGILACLGVLNV
ncbi:hypothetical protein B0H13DRAFT_1891326 [Mycena leptocephala]|nr:hypothetical protein B0H13DRAFT_1891326 [Mycena leptocephala]